LFFFENFAGRGILLAEYSKMLWLFNLTSVLIAALVWNFCRLKNSRVFPFLLRQLNRRPPG
jgi:type IV secretory pathway TrbL component